MLDDRPSRFRTRIHKCVGQPSKILNFPSELKFHRFFFAIPHTNRSCCRHPDVYEWTLNKYIPEHNLLDYLSLEAVKQETTNYWHMTNPFGSKNQSESRLVFLHRFRQATRNSLGSHRNRCASDVEVNWYDINQHFREIPFGSRSSNQKREENAHRPSEDKRLSPICLVVGVRTNVLVLSLRRRDEREAEDAELEWCQFVDFSPYESHTDISLCESHVSLCMLLWLSLKVNGKWQNRIINCTFWLFTIHV